MKSFKEIHEALSLDAVNKTPGSEEVTVFLGRMQPPTKAHIKIIDDAWKKHKKKVIIAVVKSGNDDSPFPLKLVAAMIKKATTAKFEILELSSGFIGDFISPLRDQGMEPTIILAGTDRVKSYAGQIKRYAEPFNLNITVEEIKRTDEDISASKVRAAIVNDDLDTFEAMMHKKLHPYFNKLKGYIK
jgi:hypothetical protein